MKIKKNFRYFLFILIFSVSFVQISAENLKANNISIVNIEPAPNMEISLDLGINDSVAIFLPEYMDYMEGIELKFSIPEIITYWTESVLCSIYKDIDPIPEETVLNYSGTKFFSKSLPNKFSWVVQIPLIEDNSIKSNNYTQKTDIILTPKNNILVMNLQSAIKTLPEEALESVISVNIKPILVNKGKLKLSLIPPEENLKTCSIFIDDKMIEFSENKNELNILLPTGIHDISIISEAYRDELRTVRIEQARDTELEIEMKSIEPTLVISAPEGTSVFFDDKEYNNLDKEFKITEGEHRIKFMIGNYEMVRTIDAVKGRSYKAVFSLDLQITEE